MKKNDLSNVVTGAFLVGVALMFVLFCSQLLYATCAGECIGSGNESGTPCKDSIFKRGTSGTGCTASGSSVMSSGEFNCAKDPKFQYVANCDDCKCGWYTGNNGTADGAPCVCGDRENKNFSY